MKRTRYLIRIGNVWYVRIRWPKEVAHLLPGTHFKRSLRTTSREEAVEKLPLLQLEFQRQVQEAKAGLTRELPHAHQAVAMPPLHPTQF